MTSKLKLLPLFALVALVGCERSADVQVVEPPQEVSEAPDVADSQDVSEVAETPSVEETLVEAPDEVGTAEVQVPEPTIAVEDIPPLSPLPWLTGTLPDSGTPELVHFATDAGDLFIAVYPQAAPNAAERFLHLVEIGYYDGSPVSRVVPGFVAQFGINWRDDYKQWRNDNFDDDPTLFALSPGTLAFAKAGPNTNSTQVFINYTNNNRLADPQYNFTVFGQVFEGMETVNSFRAVGDPTGGLNQTLLWDGGQAYLDYLPEKPHMILKASRIQRSPD